MEGKRRLTPAAVIVAECCKGLVERIKQSIFVVTLWMLSGQQACIEQPIAGSEIGSLYHTNRRC